MPRREPVRKGRRRCKRPLKPLPCAPPLISSTYSLRRRELETVVRNRGICFWLKRRRRTIEHTGCSRRFLEHTPDQIRLGVNPHRQIADVHLLAALAVQIIGFAAEPVTGLTCDCLLYTSP